MQWYSEIDSTSNWPIFSEMFKVAIGLPTLKLKRSSPSLEPAVSSLF